jgi:hypothetical protein
MMMRKKPLLTERMRIQRLEFAKPTGTGMRTTGSK